MITPDPTITMLATDRLVPHPANPRGSIGDVTDLAASIRSVGIEQPLVVFPAPARPGTWVILIGHRRHAAARLLGMREVPCIVRTDVTHIDDQLVAMIVENVQRTDLGPVEKAEAYDRLRQRGLSVAKIAAEVGLSESQVRKSLDLLDLAPETLEGVRAGLIKVTDAREAIKDTRAATRDRNGASYARRNDPVPRRPATAQTVTEPAHFSGRHPLASAWRLRCQRYSHLHRPRLAGACQQCIEATIRADERGRIQSGTTEDQELTA